MLFGVVYKTRNSSEEGERRSLQLFTSWQPPFEFKAHYAFADGSGGMGVVEADSGAQILEGTGVWWPWFDFELLPVIPIEEAVPIYQKINDWRSSVGG